MPGTRLLLQLYALVALVAACGAAHATAPAEALRNLLASLPPEAAARQQQPASARFTQWTHSPLLRAPAESRGRFIRLAGASAAAPELHWRTDHPEPATLIIRGDSATFIDPATGLTETHPVRRHPLLSALFALDAEAIIEAAEIYACVVEGDIARVALRPSGPLADVASASPPHPFEQLTVELELRAARLIRLHWAEADGTRVEIDLEWEAQPAAGGDGPRASAADTSER